MNAAEAGEILGSRRAWDVVHAFERGEREVALWTRHSDRLTQEEKRAVADGEMPVIVRPLEPHWKVGDWLKVVENLDLRVTLVTWMQRGFYRTEYVARDFRPAFMRRVPPVTTEEPAFDIYGDPIEATSQAIEAARADGSYSRSYGLAVPDSAEEIDAPMQEAYGRQARRNFGIVQAERLAKRDIRSVSQKLRRVQGEAIRKGIDISSDVKEIRHQVEGLERKLSEAA